MQTLNMILTLPYLKAEALAIASHWNGSDDRFVDGNGDLRTEEDVNYAEDIIRLCDELEELYKLI